MDQFRVDFKNSLGLLEIEKINVSNYTVKSCRLRVKIGSVCIGFIFLLVISGWVWVWVMLLYWVVLSRFYSHLWLLELLEYLSSQGILFGCNIHYFCAGLQIASVAFLNSRAHCRFI